MQSWFYDVAEAGSKLSYSGGDKDIPLEFYREFVKNNDIESDSRLCQQLIDNEVLDLSTLISGYLNHRWEREFEVEDDRIYETIEDVFGPDLAYHWEHIDDGFTHGFFHDEVGSEQIFRSIANLSETAEIYYPDHSLESISAASNSKIRELRDSTFNTHKEFKDKSDDFRKFKNQIITALNDEGTELHNMRDAGMYEEASNGYDGNAFRTLNFTEDDTIKDAADELEGNTVIATFDTDFLDSNLTALPPHLLAQILD